MHRRDAAPPFPVPRDQVRGLKTPDYWGSTPPMAARDLETRVVWRRGQKEAKTAHVRKSERDFPGGPGVQTAFQCRGHRFQPRSGN